MRDRMLSDQIPLTQEQLATMLGVRRPTVTIAAGSLQDAGLISYRYGRVTIIDRDGLRRTACDCHVASKAGLSRNGSS